MFCFFFLITWFTVAKTTYSMVLQSFYLNQMMYIFILFSPHRWGFVVYSFGFFFIGYWIWGFGFFSAPFAVALFFWKTGFVRNLVEWVFVLGGFFGAVLVGFGFVTFFHCMPDAFEFLRSFVLLDFCQVIGFSTIGLFCSDGQACGRTGAEP